MQTWLIRSEGLITGGQEVAFLLVDDNVQAKCAAV